MVSMSFCRVGGVCFSFALEDAEEVAFTGHARGVPQSMHFLR
jgi:hypothetical protein